MYESIKPLFSNKPLIVVANKSDIIKLEELPADRRSVLKELEEDKELSFLQMSTVTDEGVMEVKTEACEKLLSYRVDQKMRTKRVLKLKNVSKIVLIHPTFSG